MVAEGWDKEGRSALCLSWCSAAYLLPVPGCTRGRDGTAPSPSTRTAELPDAVPAPRLGVTLG